MVLWGTQWGTLSLIEQHDRVELATSPTILRPGLVRAYHRHDGAFDWTNTHDHCGRLCAYQGSAPPHQKGSGPASQRRLVDASRGSRNSDDGDAQPRGADCRLSISPSALVMPDVLVTAQTLLIRRRILARVPAPIDIVSKEMGVAPLPEQGASHAHSSFARVTVDCCKLQ